MFLLGEAGVGEDMVDGFGGGEGERGGEEGGERVPRGDVDFDVVVVRVVGGFAERGDEGFAGGEVADGDVCAAGGGLGIASGGIKGELTRVKRNA